MKIKQVNPNPIYVRKSKLIYRKPLATNPTCSFAIRGGKVYRRQRTLVTAETGEKLNAPIVMNGSEYGSLKSFFTAIKNPEPEQINICVLQFTLGSI